MPKHNRITKARQQEARRIAHALSPCMTRSECARILGTSPEQIAYIENQALWKIRTAILFDMARINRMNGADDASPKRKNPAQGGV